MADPNNSISNNDTHKQVHGRLLDVAEKLFAEKGFDDTSIRDITSQAKCNVAAVNYHFGGKEKLYSEVFRRRMVEMHKVRITSIEMVMSRKDNEPTLEELIRRFAAAFIEPLMNKSQGRQLMKLMVHEILKPHLPKKMFAEEIAIPTLNALGKAITTICPNLGQKEAVMSIISVIGQLVHTVHLNELFSTESIGLPKLKLAEMMEHIVAFSAD